MHNGNVRPKTISFFMVYLSIREVRPALKVPVSLRQYDFLERQDLYETTVIRS